MKTVTKEIYKKKTITFQYFLRIFLTQFDKSGLTSGRAWMLLAYEKWYRCAL